MVILKRIHILIMGRIAVLVKHLINRRRKIEGRRWW